MGSSLIHCSLCMFLPAPEGDVAFFDTNIVTVVNGHAMCSYHLRQFPPGGEWRRMYEIATGNAPTDVLGRSGSSPKS